jgi:DNA-binding XRE family transcriptional regulator
MAKRYKKDPRTPEQKAADDEMRLRYERKFLAEEFSKFIASAFGDFRRRHNITQQELADVIGSNKTFVSRFESGRYSGLTIKKAVEIFLALEQLRQKNIKKG